MNKINTKGNQLFNVPNNSEGRLFIRLLNKFRNDKNNYYKPLGRGSRKNGKGTQSMCPLKNSGWFAVYNYKRYK